MTDSLPESPRNDRLRSVPGRQSPPGDPLAARLDPEPRSEVEHSCSTSERARAGDRAAFEALATEAFPGLVRLCGSLERDRDGALDLAQEALARALEAIAQFRGEASFATWVRRIARNVFLNRRARAATRRERGSEPEALEGFAARGQEDPGARMERLERAERVRAALAELPEEQRTALVLCDRDGASYKEIAEIMGTPIGTVMWRIHVARKRLRTALAAEEDAIDGRPA